MGKWLLCGVLAASIGCSNAERNARTNAARTDTASRDLVTSVEVEVGADTVRFVFHVTNASAVPIRLEFPTSQRYDFVVRARSDGQVWRWSDGQMFAQHVSQETLEPNATLDYDGEWDSGGHKGAFTVTATLSASNRHVEQQANFPVR